MLGRLQTALKFLTYGLLIGIFFAPNSGAETRRKVTGWVTSGAKDFMGNITGGDSN
ncbi:MAG: YtxH domain-containing protein [Sphaerobacteraceae bacterium]|nr:MAG: YtxH domain-containing protein [Sphaerobacteraceae bacterium]